MNLEYKSCEGLWTITSEQPVKPEQQQIYVRISKWTYHSAPKFLQQSYFYISTQSMNEMLGKKKPQTYTSSSMCVNFDSVVSQVKALILNTNWMHLSKISQKLQVTFFYLVTIKKITTFSQLGYFFWPSKYWHHKNCRSVLKCAELQTLEVIVGSKWYCDLAYSTKDQ